MKSPRMRVSHRDLRNELKSAPIVRGQVVRGGEDELVQDAEEE